jgi:hypothetical protein
MPNDKPPKQSKDLSKDVLFGSAMPVLISESAKDWEALCLQIKQDL